MAHLQSPQIEAPSLPPLPEPVSGIITSDSRTSPTLLSDTQHEDIKATPSAQSGLKPPNQRRGGRIPGSINYQREEIELLLRIVDNKMPTSTGDWAFIAERYNKEAPNLVLANGLKPAERECDSLKRKYMKLASVKRSSTDPSCPQDVRTAKTIAVKIQDKLCGSSQSFLSMRHLNENLEREREIIRERKRKAPQLQTEFEEVFSHAAPYLPDSLIHKLKQQVLEATISTAFGDCTDEHLVPLGLQISKWDKKWPVEQELQISPWDPTPHFLTFFCWLDENWTLNSEATCRTLIDLCLLEVFGRLPPHTVKSWGHVYKNYIPMDAKSISRGICRGIHGKIDYLISSWREGILPHYPHLVVTQTGITWPIESPYQILAEMLAIQEDNKDHMPVYGILSSGTDWQFFKLLPDKKPYSSHKFFLQRDMSTVFGIIGALISCSLSENIKH